MYRTEYTDDYDPQVLDMPEDTQVVLRSDLWGGSWVAATFVKAYPDHEYAGHVYPSALVVLAGHVRTVHLWRVHRLDQFVAGKYSEDLTKQSWSGQIVHPLDGNVHDGRRADRPEKFTAYADILQQQDES